MPIGNLLKSSHSRLHVLLEMGKPYSLVVLAVNNVLTQILLTTINFPKGSVHKVQLDFFTKDTQHKHIYFYSFKNEKILFKRILYLKAGQKNVS